MRKILTLFITLTLFTGVLFAQDFGSEADDLQELQAQNQNKNEYLFGFDVSLLGIEPIFQWIHNDHLELQGGISFIQYGSAFWGDEVGTVGVITPQIECGYRTKFYSTNTHFSIGLANGCALVVNDNFFQAVDALGIYLKVSKTLGIFELGGKTYVPLFAAGYSSKDGPACYAACADWKCYCAGLALTCFEVKIHI